MPSVISRLWMAVGSYKRSKKRLELNIHQASSTISV